MDNNAPKLEFFGDFKDKFFLLLGGIVSLTTFIPAFLNSTSRIFGWEHIYMGYDVFVTIYFIFPYVFYLLYCSIHDDVGYLELLPAGLITYINGNKLVKTAVELVLPLVVLVYLVFAWDLYDFIFSIVFCLAGLLCFAWFIFIYYPFRALRSEILIIGSVVSLLFGLFFLSLQQRERRQPHRIFSYKAADQHAAFAAYEAKDKLQGDFIPLLDSISRVASRYRVRAALLYPFTGPQRRKNLVCPDYGLYKLYQPVHALDIPAIPGAGAIARQDSVLRAAAKHVFQHEQLMVARGDTDDVWQVYLADRYCRHLADYGRYIQQAKTLLVAEKWAMLLKVLQYKSLAWFYFLIMLGLCLWLKLQVTLQGITNPANARRALVADDAGQVKALVFLLFLLIIPWFRTIDAKDVALDRPFLNLSLNNLVAGRNGPPEGPPPVQPPGPADSLLVIRPDSAAAPAAADTALLHRIDQHVTAVDKTTRALAKRMVGSAAERTRFNDKQSK